MPSFMVTTKSAEQVWASPDGQRKIYNLELEYEGQPMQAKTYSDAIAVVGWSGEVETYEKEGKAGMPAQTFVKQPPKEGGFQTGGYSGSNGGSAKKALGSNDPFTMYLSYAKDIMVARIAAGHVKADQSNDVIDLVLADAYVLYEGRPDAPKALDPAQVDPKQLSAILGDVTEVKGETPWNK